MLFCVLSFSQSIEIISFNSSNEYCPGGGVTLHINPIIGMAWEGFKFGYSYDFNLSKIGGDGGISEFSITYDFLNNKDCFGCPEY